MVVFCPKCQSVAKIRPELDLIFQCVACSTEVKGGPADAIIVEESFKASATATMFGPYLDSAAYDPAGTHVKFDCPKCGRDYVTLVVLSDAMKTLYVCKCGERYDPAAIKTK